MIKVKDVTVDYGDISFEFNQKFGNNITFITGRNGTGKTTLLKAIAGLIDYSGDIEGTGTYFSQDPVIFNRTVYENIIYPLTIRGLDLADYNERIIDLAKKLDVYKLFNKNAKKLSGGEKIKVALIRGIIYEPEVILLDEPTTHLDIESIDELIVLLKELKHRMTIIIVSHNKAFMEELMESEYRLERNDV